jgi:hypothetical protein
MSLLRRAGSRFYFAITSPILVAVLCGTRGDWFLVALALALVPVVGLKAWGTDTDPRVDPKSG